MKQKLLPVALLALGTTFAGSASAIEIGGITWDETSGFDFSSQGSISETDVGAVGDILQIWGRINDINGSAIQLSGGATELTFSGSYEVTAVGDFDGNGTVDIVFDQTGGIDFYVDQGGIAFNAGNQASAEDGVLWLTIQSQATDHAYNGNIQTGDLFAELNAGLVFGDIGDAGSGFGVFDVTGGPAASALDTNTITTLAGQDLTNGPADLTFTNSFQPSGVDGILIASGELQGKTNVPEPSSIALLGLGLLGMTSFKRKMKRS